jgi:hypothetical protein
MSMTQRKQGRNIWNKTLARSNQYAEMVTVRSKLEVFSKSSVVKKAFSARQALKEEGEEREADARQAYEERVRGDFNRRESSRAMQRPHTSEGGGNGFNGYSTLGGLGDNVQVYGATLDMAWQSSTTGTANTGAGAAADDSYRPGTSPPPGRLQPGRSRQSPGGNGLNRPGTSPTHQSRMQSDHHDRPGTSTGHHQDHHDNANHQAFFSTDESSHSSYTNSVTLATAAQIAPTARPSTSPLFKATAEPHAYLDCDEMTLTATRLSQEESRRALPRGIHDAPEFNSNDDDEPHHRQQKHHNHFPHLKFQASRHRTIADTRPGTAPDAFAAASTNPRQSLMLIKTERHRPKTGRNALMSSDTFDSVSSSAPVSLNTIQRARKMALFEHLKMSDTDKNLTPLQKRELRDQMAMAKRKSIIDRRNARSSMSDAAKEHEERQMQWLRFLAVQECTKGVKIVYDRAMEKKAHTIKINNCAKVIQKQWETFYAPIRKRKKEGVQIALVKFSFRLLSRLAKIRKRLAKKKVLQFYADFSRQRFAFVMVKFRFNCVKLQRRIRSYGECRKARVLVLSMFWNKVEAEIKEKVERKIALHGNQYAAGLTGGKWKVKLVGNRFPDLALKINAVTEDCVNLHKTIQKGVNTVAQTMPKVLEKMRENKAKESTSTRRSTMAALKEFNSTSCVPEHIKLAALKNYLIERRAVHGEHAWHITRGGNVAAGKLNIEAVGQILRGEMNLDDHVSYQVNKITWPTFMMLSDKEGREKFEELVEFHVEKSIVKKNDDLQRMVKERLEKELAGIGATLVNNKLPGGYRWVKGENEGVHGDPNNPNSPERRKSVNSPKSSSGVVVFGGTGLIKGSPGAITPKALKKSLEIKVAELDGLPKLTL